MPDILIRDVPAGVLEAIDTVAARMGLSRTEFLRREITQIAATRRPQRCTPEDWQRFAERFADLDDPDVMRQAWS